MKNFLIDVPELCGEDLISRTAGRILRERLLENWGQDKISILFNGKTVRSSSFLDEAVALLVRDHGKTIQELQKKLEFPDLDAIDRKLLNDSIKKRLRET